MSPGTTCSRRITRRRARSSSGTTDARSTRPTFDGPASALRCAAAINRAAAREGLHIRASVHVGEVQLVGTDVRGIAVHEAARILSAAAADEIMVSATTRALTASSGFAFQSRGTRQLKGLEGEWELFAYLEHEESTPD